MMPGQGRRNLCRQDRSAFGSGTARCCCQLEQLGLAHGDGVPQGEEEGGPQLPTLHICMFINKSYSGSRALPNDKLWRQWKR